MRVLVVGLDFVEFGEVAFGKSVLLWVLEVVDQAGFVVEEVDADESVELRVGIFVGRFLREVDSIYFHSFDQGRP